MQQPLSVGSSRLAVVRTWLLFALLFGVFLSAQVRGAYVPRQDPYALPQRQEFLWRGDQQHLRINPHIDFESPSIFHVSDFRWTFQRRPSEEREELWEAIFADARIDLSRVRAISMVWSPFFPRKFAGHVGIFLEMDPGGLQLEGSQAERSDLSPVSAGVVISVEARMRHGQRYGFTAGLRGKFPLIYSVSTLENYRQRCLDVHHKEMHRWRLVLAPHEVRAVARVALETALQDHREENYHLVRKSCGTEFVDLLIAGLEASKRSDREDPRIQGLRQSQRLTRALSDPVVAQAAESRSPSWWKKLSPRYWLGLQRNHIRRTAFGGFLLNPMMSFPARLPGVLYRRGLLRSKRPDSVEVYQGHDSPREKKRKGFFRRLFRR
jgi:hypothetical protein